jgi:hypothetical protein
MHETAAEDQLDVIKETINSLNYAIAHYTKSHNEYVVLTAMVDPGKLDQADAQYRELLKLGNKARETFESVNTQYTVTHRTVYHKSLQRLVGHLGVAVLPRLRLRKLRWLPEPR